MGNQRIITATLAVVIAGAMILAMGCERDQYDPEASSVEVSESSDNAGGSHHYSMQIEGAEIEPDKVQTASIEIYPGSDLRINLDFPWSLDFEETPGVEMTATSLSKEDMDLEEERAVLPVELEAAEQGEYTVKAEGNFSVCNDEICHILRGQEVEFVVDARP